MIDTSSILPNHVEFFQSTKNRAKSRRMAPNRVDLSYAIMLHIHLNKACPNNPKTHELHRTRCSNQKKKSINGALFGASLHTKNQIPGIDRHMIHTRMLHIHLQKPRMNYIERINKYSNNGPLFGASTQKNNLS